jgi:hypothetical protein
MEVNQQEVKAVEQAAAFQEVTELELALVGGGIGNVLMG